jgi:hypothetical protein
MTEPAAPAGGRSAHIISAVAMVSAHCMHTGQDYEHSIAMVRDLFDNAVEILRKRISHEKN